MTTTDKTDTAAPKLRRCPGCGAVGPVAPCLPGLGRVRVSCKCGVAGPWAETRALADEAWDALPRRKRVGRKKAEAAVDDLIGRAERFGFWSARSGAATPGSQAARDAGLEANWAAIGTAHVRVRLMAMLTGEAEPTGAGEVGR